MMSAPLDSGQTKFLPAALPLLEDGEYQVKVQQTVHSPQSSELPGAGVSFWVKGPRFALNPKDVFSQHPSPGKVGAFGNELPHIVLSRKTLPWERSIDDQSPPAPPAVPTPWLALLVVDEHDPGAPTSTSDHWVSSGTVGDLLPENQGGYCPSTTFGPQLLNIGDGSPLDPWEKVSDACHYIDLPTALFSQIAPSLEELTLLSHVREVNTGHQAIDDIKADGSYAVVVSNRFPYSESYNPPPTGLGVKNTVCLVSLEGLQKNLPGGEAIPDTYTHVRVAVLSHWSFFDNGGDNVQAMLEKLDVGPLNRTGTWYPGSESPSPTPTPQNPAPFSSYVDCAFTMGYTALNHNTRVGERVVSWYRGPLRPFFTGSGANQRFLSSDAALEYSPDSGMFDVSHAAAWQLGQLLALQSKQFATALYNFRRNALAKYATQKSLARIHQTSKQVLRSGESETEGKILDDFTRWLGSGELVEVLTKTGEEGSGAVASVVDKVEAALETVEEAIDEVEEKFREPDPALEVRRALDATSGTTQATATATLDGTAVASHITITNPGSGYVTAPQVSFVGGGGSGAAAVSQIDDATGEVTAITLTSGGSGYTSAPNVTIARPLVPGVISDWLGSLYLLYGVPLRYLVPDVTMLPLESFRYFYVDPIWVERLIDGALSIGRSSNASEIQDLLDETMAGDFLDQAQQAAHQVRGRKLAEKGLVEVGEPTQQATSYTGFVFRSSLVQGWKGLEFKAYSNTQLPPEEAALIAPVRLERIAPDIMLGIYPREIQQVAIKQPPQGLQFGAEGKPGQWTLADFRYLSGDRAGDAFIPSEASSLAVPNRTSDDRVVDMTNFAAALGNLSSEIMLPAGQDGKLNSADLAIELVLAAAYTIFTPTASATAKLDGDQVSGIEVDHGGAGYASAPAVNFTDGGGNGAAAIADIENGKVVGIKVTQGGSGYDDPPVVQIAPPTGSGA